MFLLLLPREYAHYQRVQSWERIDGAVESSYSSRARYGGYACLIDLVYQYEGKNYSAKVSRIGQCVVKNGSLLPIYVDPSNPQDFEDGYDGLLFKLFGQK